MPHRRNWNNNFGRVRQTTGYLEAASNSGAAYARTTVGATTSTWEHAVFVFNSDTDRRVYLNGTNKVTDTTSAVVTGIGSLVVGSLWQHNQTQALTGSLAEVAFYGSALSDANVALLAGGSSPNNVDSGNLLSYYTLLLDNSEDGGGTALTEVASPTYSSSDHPPVAGLTLREPTFLGIGSLTVTAGVSNINHLGIIPASPVTLTQPGWDPACDQGSISQWNTPIPIEQPILAASTSVEPTDQQPMDQEKHGGAGPIAGIDTRWFEAAHLIPRLVQDLGNVISDQVIQCELYNADRHNSITVTSIVDNLGSGFQVGGVPATPFDIETQDGLQFTLTVLGTGDLTIDGTYTLILSTGEEYVLTVIGSRIVLFPIRPEAPLREHLIFDTKIVEAVGGTEQRRANREFPRGLFEATYRKGRKEIEMLLFDRQAKIVAVPAWHEPAFPTSVYSIDDVTVNVNTTDYANFYVGGYAVVLEDQYTFDALRIESMTATSLTFESGLSFDYTTRAEVMPLMTAYIEPASASLKKPYNDQDFNLRFHIDPTDNDIADSSGWSTYDGQVFLDDPNLIAGGQLTEALRTKVVVIDNLTGLRSQVSAWEHNKRYSKKGFKTNTRAELWKLRQLLHYFKGKQVSFYIPTFSKDIVPTEDMLIGTFGITMANIGYTINARERWPKQVIRVVFTDGSKLTRTIQDSSEVSSGVEQLTLDLAWPATHTPDEIERIEFLEKIRLDIDDIVIVHYNALGQSQCIVPVKEVDE